MEQQISAFQVILNKVIDFCVTYSFQVLGAVIILIIGWVVAGWAQRAVLALFQKKNFDITLSKFIALFLKIIVLTFTLIVAMGNFGITIAPFVAALGGLAFGTSFALQGPLSNYGAGLSIILTRPFIVGDTVTIAGVSGVVQDVKLACTVLSTEDSVLITIPNKHIVGEILHNSKHVKIAEGVVGIAYGADPDAAIRVIQRTLESFPDVSKEPAPQIGIQAFGDSSVNIGFRYWLPTLKFFQSSYAVNLAIFKAFRAADVPIPFPQREIRILSDAKAASNGGADKHLDRKV